MFTAETLLTLQIRGTGLIIGTEFTDNKSPNDIFPPEWGKFDVFIYMEKYNLRHALAKFGYGYLIKRRVCVYIYIYLYMGFDPLQMVAIGAVWPPHLAPFIVRSGKHDLKTPGTFRDIVLW